MEALESKMSDQDMQAKTLIEMAEIAVRRATTGDIYD
jgi:hypothetical protein